MKIAQFQNQILNQEILVQILIFIKIIREIKILLRIFN